MNFRQLIEKAMLEAQHEFAAIVAAKLSALMGDGGAASSSGEPRGVTSYKATASAGGPSRQASNKASSKPANDAPAKRGRPKGSDKQRRAAPDHMAKLQDRVLGAMTVGQPMKKGAIMKAARIADSEETRVRNVLAKLKVAGILSMKGVRGSAVYTLEK